MTWTDNHLPSWVDRDRWNEHQLSVHEEICRAWDEGNQLVILDAPPGCLAGDTVIPINRGGAGKYVTIEELAHRFAGRRIPSKNGHQGWNPVIETRIRRCVVVPKWGWGAGLVPVVRAIESGRKRLFHLETHSGRSIDATADHGFLMDGGTMVPLRNLRLGDAILVDTGKASSRWNKVPNRKSQYRLVQGLVNHPLKGEWPYRQPLHRLVVEASMNELRLDWYIAIMRDEHADTSMLVTLSPNVQVHHRDRNTLNNRLDNLEVMEPSEHYRHHGIEHNWAHPGNRIEADVVTLIEEGPVADTYDLTVADDPHNFVANEFVVQNSGKSLLGYMSHRHIGGDAYYLVGTKYLQGQIERTLPDAAIVKGKRNYTPTDIQDIYLQHEPTCDDCDKDEAGCSLCAVVESCPYVVAKEIAAESPLACANYKYALGEWTSPRSKFRSRDLVICDEADTLVSELQDFVSVSISRWLQKRFNIRPPDKRTVESSWPEWFEYAIPRLEEIRKLLPRETIPQRRIRARLDRLVPRMKLITEDLEGWVYDYSPKYELDEQAITFKPVTVDKVAHEALWRHGQRFLCMSASMGSPEQFTRNLGFVGQWASVFAPSTFDVSRRPIYFFPAAMMTYKTEQAETPKMIAGVRAALDEFPKARVLVLPHTYKLATALYEELVHCLPRDLFIYRNADEREEVVRLFGECESSNAPVLFAPSLGRGYDNREVDVVIICKTPFPFLGSKQVDKRHRMNDGQVWLVNETVKEIVQNYGRVMRAEDDSGVTVIADSRFSKFYSEWKRLFPTWFIEAYQQNSDVRFDLTRATRRLLNSSSP